MRLDSSRARITAPVDGSIVALIDIPIGQQKISFESSQRTASMRWKLTVGSRPGERGAIVDAAIRIASPYPG